jgi:hypothetical protein
MKIHLILSFLAILFAGDSAFGQTTFVTEFDGTFDTATETVPTRASGKILVEFTFQSTVVDSSNGSFVLPNLCTAYSLTSANRPLLGNRWVFGGPGFGIVPSIISFNTVTGFGQARAILPINATTPETVWASFEDGTNNLTLYWGTSGGMYTDGFSVPSSPMGSLQTTVVASQQDFELSFIENHNMTAGVPSSLFLFAKTPPLVDIDFNLTCSAPSRFTYPSIVTIPAGESQLIIPITPLEKGHAYFEASLVGIAPATAKSTNSTVWYSQLWALGASGVAGNPLIVTNSAECVEGGESTPERRDPTEAEPTEVACGPCGFNPGASECGAGLSGGTGFYKQTSCDIALFGICKTKQDPITVEIKKWDLVGTAQKEACLTKISIDFWARYCCTYKPTESALTIQAYTCL